MDRMISSRNSSAVASSFKRTGLLAGNDQLCPLFSGDQYLDSAAHVFDLAKRASNIGGKSHLLNLGKMAPPGDRERNPV
jgi:hypothetical protein